MTVKCPFNPAYDVTKSPWYAVPDNPAVDNREVMQACMADSAAAERQFWMPSGTFYMDTTPGQVYSLLVPSDLVVRGRGVTTILRSTAEQTVRLTSASNVTLRSFKLLGDYATTDYGIVGAGTCPNFRMYDITAVDFYNTGIYGNGFFHGLYMDVASVSHCGSFGVHFHNEGPSFSDLLTLKNIVALGFAGLTDYPAHGVYLKVCSNATLHTCEAGNTSGAGIHTGFELDDIDGGDFTDCYGHGSTHGIAVNDYPGAGCHDLAFHHCGGDDNSGTDRFEYGDNTNIVWDVDCYGDFSKYP